MASKFRTWDDYFIPGSSSVLRNKLGETTEAGLKAKEESRSLIRIAELDATPIRGAFDYAHMKAIHRHIFQDTYEWAGEERVGPDDSQFMTKGGPDPANPDGPYIGYQYAARWFVKEHLDTQYRELARLNYLQGLAKPEFVEKLADIWGEINFAHAFREGNTRAQIVFFDQLCTQAGYSLNREAFLPGTQTRDEFVNARFRVLRTGKHDTMAQFLDKVVNPIEDAQPQAAVDLRARKQRFPELFTETPEDGPSQDEADYGA